jgi:ribonuclease HI
VENGKSVFELDGFDKNTTNNRMEIKAVIEALRHINKKYEGQEVTIVADSNYVLLGITEWIHNWQKNGWRTAGKKPVLNQELWQELWQLKEGVSAKISWQKVKGHSGYIFNERADKIATTKASLQK